jgi:hypothetical protein
LAATGLSPIQTTEIDVFPQGFNNLRQEPNKLARLVTPDLPAAGTNDTFLPTSEREPQEAAERGCHPGGHGDSYNRIRFPD